MDKKTKNILKQKKTKNLSIYKNFKEELQLTCKYRKQKFIIDKYINIKRQTRSSQFY